MSHAPKPIYTGSDPVIFTTPPARSPQIPARPPEKAPRMVEITIDGVPVTAPANASILEACQAQGKDIPTLCYGETVTPEGVCRMCVVDTGGKALTPACSAKVSQGMTIDTDNDKVRHSRKLLLELLGSSVNVDLAGPALPDGTIKKWMDEYGADPSRFGPPSAPAAANERDGHHAGHHHEPDGATASNVSQPVKIDNDLFVRDYGRCILCYKCVEACGVDAQNTFAISIAGRGFDARVSTEFNVPLDESACVWCGNCINVCPTGALMFRSEFELRESGAWDESQQTVTNTICPYCGVGCTLQLHAQDGRIVKVLSPADSYVTGGNLCVKGRFGFEFVQMLPKGTPRGQMGHRPEA